MIISDIKCLNCSNYNKNDYVKFSCKKYNKIPDEIIEGIKECKEYKEVQNEA